MNVHPETRIQFADREERKHKRALEAEYDATNEEAIKRVVPETRRRDRELDPVTKTAWEDVEPGDDDWPEWADERDHIIRFVEGRTTTIQPGQEYPVRAFDGSPKHRPEFAGLDRNAPDLTQRSHLRREQSDHLERKGEVLGVYSDKIELDIEEERSLDEEDKGELLKAIENLRDGGDS